MRPTTTLALMLSLVACAACTEPVDEPGDDPPLATSAAAATPTPTQPPPPDLCNQHEPVPRPGGSCTFEVSLDQIINITGQGISEGVMEMDVVASADGASKRWPSAGSTDMVPQQKTVAGKGYVLGTYTVGAGSNRQVQLCATFTEDDDGGINGSDDVGTDCTWVTLTATAAPGNRVTCTSSPATPSVASDLCGDNQCNGRYKATFEVMVKDADMDHVENEDDFTPDVCDEEEKGQLGRASLIWFHMGDGPMTTFFQGFGTDLSKAMAGYAYKVVIIDPTYAGPFLVNAPALNSADLILSPYEDNLYLAMQEITRRGLDMDVYVFSHGSQLVGSTGIPHTHFMSLDTGECTVAPAGELCGNGRDDDGDGAIDEVGCVAAPPGELCWNDVDDDGDGVEDNADGVYDTELVENLTPAKIGTDLVPIRMDYSIACYNEGMNWAWTTVGSKVSSGTVKINFYPVFYGGFADAWNAGSTYASSVVQSDKPGDRNLVEFFVNDKGVRFDCDDLILPNDGEENLSVLDKNPCARDFFVDDDGSGADKAEYDIGVDYDATKSGVANMDAQSRRVTTGTSSIKKFVPATLTW